MPRFSVPGPLGRLTSAIAAVAATATILGSVRAAAESGPDPFSLTLEELIEMEIDVSGSAVQNIDLAEIPSTGNPNGLRQLETPATVEIVDQNTIEARGLRNAVDVVESMNGILAGESPSEPYSFSMRGFDRGSVNVLYDGVSIGEASLNMRPIGTANLARVEVQKGPTILESGGSAAGTVNMIPRRAGLTEHHLRRGSVSAGDHGRSSLSAGLSGPWSDRVGYLDARTSRGWVEDSDSYSIVASSSIYWQAGEDLALTFSADFFEDELPGYWGTPLIPRSAATRPISVLDREGDRVIDETTRFTNYNVSDQQIGSRSQWWKAGLEWRPSDRIRARMTTYRFEADRDWRNAETYIYLPARGTVLRDRLLVTHDREVEGIDAVVNLRSEIGGRANRFSATLEARDDRFERVVGFEPIDFFVDEVDLHDPDPGIFRAAEIAERDDEHLERTLALTLSNHLELSSRWRLDLGLRAETIDFDAQRFDFDGSLRRDQRGDLQQLGFQAGLLYRWNEQTSLYGQFSRQHDSVQLALASFGSTTAEGFEAPDVEQIEIGLKCLLAEDSTELTAALFEIEKTSRVFRQGVPSSNEQSSRGLEISSRWTGSERFHLGATYSWIDAEYGSYYDSVFEVEVDGNTPPNVPEHMISLWGSWDRIAGLPIELGANISSISKHFGSSDNSVVYASYELVQAFIAYTRKNVRIALHGRNLTDEIYVPFSDPFYVDQVVLGAPRTFDLSLHFAF